MPSKIETEAVKNEFTLDEAAKLLDSTEQSDPTVIAYIRLLQSRLRATQKLLDDYRDLDAMLCK